MLRLVLVVMVGSAVLGLGTRMARADGTMARADSTRLHVEVDPLPFALGGYGLQLGVAPAALPGWRFALGNFSLDVPDAAVQLKDANDGFHLRVRRSHALYGLRFLSGLRGWCVGGSARYLRLEYTHDDSPGARKRVTEFSVEAIAGYKWHPTRHGFFVLPWVAVALPLASNAEPVVGGRTYDADPAGLFATVNIGWQFGRPQSR